MKIINLPDGGFIRFDLVGLSIHFAGIGFYFGWFPDVELNVLQITIFEVSADGSHVVPFRFQFLWFLFSVHMDST